MFVEERQIITNCAKAIRENVGTNMKCLFINMKWLLIFTKSAKLSTYWFSAEKIQNL